MRWTHPASKRLVCLNWQKLVHFVDLLCFCSVLCLLCLCARLFICALWSPAGKGLTSWLSFVVSTVSLSLSHWYPGSGVVLDESIPDPCTLTYFHDHRPIAYCYVCFGLSVPSKLAVVLFSRHSGLFPHGKNRLQPLPWYYTLCPVYGSETHIKPHSFFTVRWSGAQLWQSLPLS